MKKDKNWLLAELISMYYSKVELLVQHGENKSDNPIRQNLDEAKEKLKELIEKHYTE